MDRKREARYQQENTGAHPQSRDHRSTEKLRHGRRHAHSKTTQVSEGQPIAREGTRGTVCRHNATGATLNGVLHHRGVLVAIPQPKGISLQRYDSISLHQWCSLLSRNPNSIHDSLKHEIILQEWTPTISHADHTASWCFRGICEGCGLRLPHAPGTLSRGRSECFFSAYISEGVVQNNSIAVHKVYTTPVYILQEVLLHLGIGRHTSNRTSLNICK